MPPQSDHYSRPLSGKTRGKVRSYFLPYFFERCYDTNGYCVAIWLFALSGDTASIGGLKVKRFLTLALVSSAAILPSICHAQWLITYNSAIAWNKFYPAYING